MKTTIYIITALLIFSLNTMATGLETVPVRNLTGSELAPAVPGTATFEESVPDQDFMFHIALQVLAPVVPDEADFQEETAILGDPLLPDLYPSVPASADFEDSI